MATVGDKYDHAVEEVIQENLIIEDRPVISRILHLVDQCQKSTSEKQLNFLISIWNEVIENVGHLPNIEQFFLCLFKETCKVILSEQWGGIKRSCKYQLAIAVGRCGSSLAACDGKAQKLSTALVLAIYNPWNDNAFSHQTLRNEPVELVLARVEYLLSQGKEEQASTICENYFMPSTLSSNSQVDSNENVDDSMSSSASESSLGESDIIPLLGFYVTMLFKKNKLTEIIRTCSQFNCHQGVRLVHNIQASKFPDSSALAQVLVHFFLVQDLHLPSTYCCTKELMGLWCSLQAQRSTCLRLVHKASRKLLFQHASNSAHFYLFVDMLWEQFGYSLLPLYLELFILGLTIDINHLEDVRNGKSEHLIIELETHIAGIFTKLSSLFIEKQDVLAWECLLSAFCLEPTSERLLQLDDLQEVIEKRSTEQTTTQPVHSESQISDLNVKKEVEETEQSASQPVLVESAFQNLNTKKEVEECDENGRKIVIKTEPQDCHCEDRCSIPNHGSTSTECTDTFAQNYSFSNEPNIFATEHKNSSFSTECSGISTKDGIISSEARGQSANQCSVSVKKDLSSADCNSMVNKFHFYHPILDLNVPGLSKNLLKDLVLLLEGTREISMRNPRPWTVLKPICEAMLEMETAFNMMLKDIWSIEDSHNFNPNSKNDAANKERKRMIRYLTTGSGVKKRKKKKKEIHVQTNKHKNLNVEAKSKGARKVNNLAKTVAKSCNLAEYRHTDPDLFQDSILHSMSELNDLGKSNSKPKMKIQKSMQNSVIVKKKKKVPAKINKPNLLNVKAKKKDGRKENELTKILAKSCNLTEYGHTDFEYPGLFEDSILHTMSELDDFAELSPKPKMKIQKSAQNSASVQNKKKAHSQANKVKLLNAKAKRKEEQKVNGLSETIAESCNLTEYRHTDFEYPGLFEDSILDTINQLNDFAELSPEPKTKIQRSVQSSTSVKNKKKVHAQTNKSKLLSTEAKRKEAKKVNGLAKTITESSKLSEYHHTNFEYSSLFEDGILDTINELDDLAELNHEPKTKIQRNMQNSSSIKNKKVVHAQANNPKLLNVKSKRKDARKVNGLAKTIAESCNLTGYPHTNVEYPGLYEENIMHSVSELSDSAKINPKPKIKTHKNMLNSTTVKNNKNSPKTKNLSKIPNKPAAKTKAITKNLITNPPNKSKKKVKKLEGFQPHVDVQVQTDIILPANAGIDSNFSPILPLPSFIATRGPEIPETDYGLNFPLAVVSTSSQDDFVPFVKGPTTFMNTSTFSQAPSIKAFKNPVYYPPDCRYNLPNKQPCLPQTTLSLMTTTYDKLRNVVTSITTPTDKCTNAVQNSFSAITVSNTQEKTVPLQQTMPKELSENIVSSSSTTVISHTSDQIPITCGLSSVRNQRAFPNLIFASRQLNKATALPGLVNQIGKTSSGLIFQKATSQLATVPKVSLLQPPNPTNLTHRPKISPISKKSWTPIQRHHGNVYYQRTTERPKTAISVARCRIPSSTNLVPRTTGGDFKTTTLSTSVDLQSSSNCVSIPTNAVLKLYTQKTNAKDQEKLESPLYIMSSNRLTKAQAVLSNTTVQEHQTKTSNVPVHQVKTLTVPEHQVKTLTVTEHQPKSLTVLEHEGKPLSLPEHEAKTLTVPEHQAKTLTAPEHQDKTLTVPEHQIKTISVPEHQVKTLTVPEHQVKTLTVPKHQIKTLTVPGHQMKTLTVPEYQVKTLTLPEHQAKTLTVSEHQAKALSVPEHQAITLAVPEHQAKTLTAVKVEPQDTEPVTAIQTIPSSVGIGGVPCSVASPQMSTPNILLDSHSTSLSKDEKKFFHIKATGQEGFIIKSMVVPASQNIRSNEKKAVTFFSTSYANTVTNVLPLDRPIEPKARNLYIAPRNVAGFVKSEKPQDILSKISPQPASVTGIIVPGNARKYNVIPAASIIQCATPAINTLGILVSNSLTRPTQFMPTYIQPSVTQPCITMCSDIGKNPSKIPEPLQNAQFGSFKLVNNQKVSVGSKTIGILSNKAVNVSKSEIPGQLNQPLKVPKYIINEDSFVCQRKDISVIVDSKPTDIPKPETLSQLKPPLEIPKCMIKKESLVCPTEDDISETVKSKASNVSKSRPPSQLKTPLSYVPKKEPEVCTTEDVTDMVNSITTAAAKLEMQRALKVSEAATKRKKDQQLKNSEKQPKTIVNQLPTYVPCQDCSKKFVSPYNLKRHMKTVHNKEIHIILKKKPQDIMLPVQTLPQQLPARASPQPLSVQASLQPLPVQASLQRLPVQASLQPLPVQATLQPLPAQASLQPLPVQASHQPLLVQASLQTLPVQAALQPLPIQASLQPLPIQASLQPLPIQASLQPLPIQASLQPLPVQVSHQPLLVQASLQPLPVQTPTILTSSIQASVIKNSTNPTSLTLRTSTPTSFTPVSSDLISPALKSPAMASFTSTSSSPMPLALTPSTVTSSSLMSSTLTSFTPISPALNSANPESFSSVSSALMSPALTSLSGITSAQNYPDLTSSALMSSAITSSAETASALKSTNLTSVTSTSSALKSSALPSSAGTYSSLKSSNLTTSSSTFSASMSPALNSLAMVSQDLTALTSQAQTSSIRACSSQTTSEQRFLPDTFSTTTPAIRQASSSLDVCNSVSFDLDIPQLHIAEDDNQYNLFDEAFPQLQNSHSSALFKEMSECAPLPKSEIGYKSDMNLQSNFAHSFNESVSKPSTADYKSTKTNETKSTSFIPSNNPNISNHGTTVDGICDALQFEQNKVPESFLPKDLISVVQTTQVNNETLNPLDLSGKSISHQKIRKTNNSSEPLCSRKHIQSCVNKPKSGDTKTSLVIKTSENFNQGISNVSGSTGCKSSDVEEVVQHLLCLVNKEKTVEKCNLPVDKVNTSEMCFSKSDCGAFMKHNTNNPTKLSLLCESSGVCKIPKSCNTVEKPVLKENKTFESLVSSSEMQSRCNELVKEVSPVATNDMPVKSCLQWIIDTTVEKMHKFSPSQKQNIPKSKAKPCTKTQNKTKSVSESAHGMSACTITRSHSSSVNINDVDSSADENICLNQISFDKSPFVCERKVVNKKAKVCQSKELVRTVKDTSLNENNVSSQNCDKTCIVPSPGQCKILEDAGRLLDQCEVTDKSKANVGVLNAKNGVHMTCPVRESARKRDTKGHLKRTCLCCVDSVSLTRKCRTNSDSSTTNINSKDSACTPLEQHKLLNSKTPVVPVRKKTRHNSTSKISTRSKPKPRTRSAI